MQGYKKHRGLKRYYKNLAFKDDFKEHYSLDFDNPKPWFKSQHFHFDRRGYGDNGSNKRKPHLDKLFRHFDILVEKTKSVKAQFQLYAVLLDYNSCSDALFLHAPSTDNGQSPFKISDLQLTTTLTNKWLNEYIDSLVGYKKMYGKANGAFCLIFKENIGQTF